MKIIVCVKQVPDTSEVKIDPVKGTLIRDGVPSILNPDDANALEAALFLKDKLPGTIVNVITMGPPQATYMLRECLAMGADNAYLLSDKHFGGADTFATSSTLAAGIKKIGGADIVLAGKQAIDGDTAQVGPQIATKLGLPVITGVQKIELDNNALIVERQTEYGYDIVRLPTPCLMTVISKLNTPRYMKIHKIIEAYKESIIVWTHDDLGMDVSECGLDASPTKVLRSFTAAPKQQCEMLFGDIEATVQMLCEKIHDKHII